MTTTVYICSKCGETTADWENIEDWLIAAVPGSTTGEMVIRCPDHITEYAIRKAGGRITRSRGDGRIGTVKHWEYNIS